VLRVCSIIDSNKTATARPGGGPFSPGVGAQHNPSD
jgi:hypothetical protein